MNKHLYNFYENECKFTIQLSTNPEISSKTSLISFWGLYKDTETYRVIVSPTREDAYMIAKHLINKGDFIDVVGKIKLITPKKSSDPAAYNMIAASRIIYKTKDFERVLNETQK